MSYKKSLKGLYVITDNKLTPNDTIIQNVESSLKGGAKIVQLRDKVNDDETIIKIATTLQELCKKYDATFIMNDRVDLAIKLKTDGLHIGKSDYENFINIRRDFDGLIGVSCYGNVNKAKEFETFGADYVAFGSFFSSPTKPDSNIVDLETIKVAKNRLNIPVCAIGGINIENVQRVLNNRPDMICVISDIFSSDDIEKKCKDYINLIKETTCK
jgi:thiamine-phosphate pyrophosphorylase